MPARSSNHGLHIGKIRTEVFSNIACHFSLICRLDKLRGTKKRTLERKPLNVMFQDAQLSPPEMHDIHVGSEPEGRSLDTNQAALNSLGLDGTSSQPPDMLDKIVTDFTLSKIDGLE